MLYYQRYVYSLIRRLAVQNVNSLNSNPKGNPASLDPGPSSGNGGATEVQAKVSAHQPELNTTLAVDLLQKTLYSTL